MGHCWRRRVIALAAFLTALTGGGAPGQPVEVEFTGAGGLALRGTLLLPGAPAGEGPARHAALLLLPGSGPTDRDGNQRPMLVTDLLRQVAERLAAEGIATLRFDKRAVGAYSASWPRDLKELDAFFSFENFVADAAAGLAFLRSHERIDGGRVGVLGHSEGGLIALKLGADGAGTPEAPAALILAGTAGRRLDAVVREQIAALLEKQTDDAEVRRVHLEATDRAIEAVLARRDLPADLPAGLRPLFNPTVATLLHAYFTIDPADLASKVTGPVLVVQGAEDEQVSAERDTPRLEGALRARAGGACEVLIVPGASHNLKPAAGGAIPGFTGPAAPEALDRIASWTREHLGAR